MTRTGTKTIRLVLALALAALSAPVAAYGQTVDEITGKVIHVDRVQADASDNNPGSVERPLATIGKGVELALAANRNGTGVRVVIHAGIYREQVNLHGSPSATDAPMVIEGAGDGITAISGSDVWSGWNQTSSGVYSHHWGFDWGETALPNGWETVPGVQGNSLLRRREMVFVNGRHLRQVQSQGAVAARRGTFYVSEADNTIFVSPPPGATMGDSRVEVSVRPFAFVIGSKNNVTLKGLTFRHASTPIENYAVQIANTSNVQVLDSRVMWNNWIGLGFYNSRNVVVRDTLANHNGVGGMSANTIKGLLFEDTETSYNNWRGISGRKGVSSKTPIDPNFTDFGGGQKYFHLHGATFRRHTAIGNLSSGMWFDYDNTDIQLEGLDLRNNLSQGLHLEASLGPFRIFDSRICDNETGVLINSASNAIFQNNAIGRNSLGQLFLAGIDGPRAVTNWETKQTSQVQSSGWQFYDNHVTNQSGQRAVRTYLVEGWRVFQDSLSSNANIWTHPNDNEIFQVANGELLDLPRWTNETGEDSNSVFAKSKPKCPPTEDRGLVVLGSEISGPPAPDKKAGGFKLPVLELIFGSFLY